MRRFVVAIIYYILIGAAKVLQYLPYPQLKRKRNTRSPEQASPYSERWNRTYNYIPLRTEAQEVQRMHRAVGYCVIVECDDYSKGVFLLNHGDTFYCPRCRELGKVVGEKGSYSGTSPIFKEVRVEFNFDSPADKFLEIAIVRDESLWGRNNVYTLQSPLIKTEKRALKVAESILSNLNHYGIRDGNIPRTTEIILSLDDTKEEFARKCRVLEEALEKSHLKQNSQ